MCTVVWFSRNTSRQRRRRSFRLCSKQTPPLLPFPDIPPQVGCSPCSKHFILLLSCICAHFTVYSCSSFFYISKWTCVLLPLAEKRPPAVKARMHHVDGDQTHALKDNFTPTKEARSEQVRTCTLVGLRIGINHPSSSGWNLFPNGPHRIRIFQLTCLLEAFLFWSGFHCDYCCS